MNPLSALYGAAVGARNGLYDRGMMNVRRLEGPVIGIGNLSVGGSGKTPFLILLGELLKRRGIAFDVLSRGYRRQTRGVAIVDPNGSAPDFGDEPLLIARKLGVHVVVGEDRHRAGETAEAAFGPQLHLLDDGFQHRHLARDFDIVLIADTDAQDSLLPLGRLREPIASLARADAVVLTNGISADGLRLQDQLVWEVRRDVVAPSAKGPVIAFCAVARPENFFSQLKAAGVILADMRSFRDHHRYTDADVRDLVSLRQRTGAAALVTTEKDAVNLAGNLQALEPIHIVPVRMCLEDPDAALDAMLATIARRKQRPA